MSNLIILSAEGDRFLCSPLLENISQTIRDSDIEEEIDLGILEIDGASLQLVLNYCDHHKYLETPPFHKIVANDNFAGYVSDPWDVELVESLDTEQVLRLLKAANKLAIKSLVELITIKIATIFAGKSLQDYSTLIDMELSINQTEDEWLKREFAWAIESPGSEQTQDYL